MESASSNPGSGVNLKTCLCLPDDEAAAETCMISLGAVVRFFEVRLRAAGESGSDPLLSDDDVEAAELDEEDDDKDAAEEEDEDEEAEGALLGGGDSLFTDFVLASSLSESSLLEDEDDGEESESSWEERARVLVFLCRLRRGPADALPDFDFATAIASRASSGLEDNI